MPSDKIRRSRIVRGSKRSRVPIKSALKKEKDGGGEGKYHYNAASGRQTDLCPSGILFGKVRCDKAREHRLHAACAKGEHQCVEWCGELVDAKGFRTDPARQEYSIEKSKNLQMIPDAVRISVPRRSVFFLVIFSMG